MPCVGLVFAQNHTYQSEPQLIDVVSRIEESLDRINVSNTSNFLMGIAIAIVAIIATIYNWYILYFCGTCAYIAIVPIIATIYNSKKLNRQLQVNEREMGHRIRPIIVRGHYDDGNTYKIRDYNPDEKHLWIKAINTGSLPAVNIRRSVKGRVLLDEEHYLPDTEKILYKDMTALGPGEYVDNIVKLSEEQYKEICYGTRYYFELKLEYASPDDAKVYYYIIKGHFEKRVLMQDHIDIK